MEQCFQEYREHVEFLLKEETIREVVSKVKTLGKFYDGGFGKWEPVPYSGYTIITPTLPDDRVNANSYQSLCRSRDVLFRDINFPGIVMAPTTELHMTVARLVSGDVFTKSVMNLREDSLLAALSKLFSQISRQAPLKYEIKGLSIFPQGVIAAIVSPVSESEYQNLQKFREFIYTDKVLKDLGVDRRRGFKGHITLFYIEERLDEKQKKDLAGSLTAINRRFFSSPMPFYITRAEVRKFNDFSSFYRQDNWPVYELYN